jgi:hypothetical protein
MLCPPANLSARVNANTTERSLYTFAAGYHYAAMLISSYAEVSGLTKSQDTGYKEDIVFLIELSV